MMCTRYYPFRIEMFGRLDAYVIVIARSNRKSSILDKIDYSTYQHTSRSLYILVMHIEQKFTLQVSQEPYYVKGLKKKSETCALDHPYHNDE